MKKVIMLICAVILVFPMVVSAAFSDLSEEHWAYSYITNLSDQQVISGYPDGTFKPNGTLTKGEFLKLIMVASLPDLDFNYVEKDFDHWAAGYVKIAENYGVLEAGEINAGNINETINRIDVVRIMGLADINIRGAEQYTTPLLEFNDISELNDTETVMLGHAVACEIIGGYPDGTFMPKKNLTRAEVSKILSVYIGTDEEVEVVEE